MTACDFFAGANTARGYECFAEDYLPRGEGARVCLLRGGAGLDAAALLEKAAARWQTQGRGVRRLAGAGEALIAITSGDWALADASAAHGLTPQAGDKVIDLCRAVDADALRPWRGEAQALARRVNALQARALRCLRAAKTALSDSAAIYAEAVDAGALCNLRLELTRWMEGEAGPVQRGFAQAVTAAGVVSRAAACLRPHTLCLDLPFGLDADAVLYPLAVALHARGAGYQAGMQLLDGARLAHLCTATHAVVSFVEPGCPVRTLRLDEHVLRREREALAFNRAAYDLWLSRAVETLAAARDCRERLSRLVLDAARPMLLRALEAEAMAYFE